MASLSNSDISAMSFPSSVSLLKRSYTSLIGSVFPRHSSRISSNINNSVNVDNRNRIHPFYMVYIGVDGLIICDYLNPKKMLDDIRLLCRGKSAPIKEAYERFNRETDDGRNMAEMSELLSEAINSIIDVKEESDIDSLFSAGGTSALMRIYPGWMILN